MTFAAVMRSRRVVGWAAVAAVVAVAALAGCGNEAKVAGEGAAASGASAPAPAASGAAAVSITTVRAQRRDVDVLLDATGTVTALNSVDVRPQIASVITQVHIREGQFVKAGQLLFTLDARSDEMTVARLRTQLGKELATLADAQRQLARSRELLAQNFISQGAVDTTQTVVDIQQAVVSGARAAIGSAQLVLSYNRIVAPSAGRAGAINVFVGTTVQPVGAALVTITQLDPIAVSFKLPQRHLNDVLLALRSAPPARAGGGKSAGAGAGAGAGGKVTAVLPDQRGSAVGRLRFVDNAVDPNSGTVRVKAEFANHDELLWPGGFVSVRLAVRTLKDATVLPQAAVIQAPRGAIVYVVDAQNKAQARPVEVVYSAGLDAVVTGVQPGERIVVDGRQNLRGGVAVAERAASAASAASAPRTPRVASAAVSVVAGASAAPANGSAAP